MDNNNTLQKVNALVEKYQEIERDGRTSKYNEEMTKKDFILPLFEALGWNTTDSREVSAEEKISKKRVDYGFRINGIPKFFLEAKSFKEDLDNRKFIEQAISYAWHKGCTWAVLTNFESLKIFNAEVKTEHPWLSQFKPALHCYEYSTKFDELLLLSRESFENRLLDIEAEKWGKKAKKTAIDRQLLSDFTHFREILSKNITKLNSHKNLSEEELDEAVQRILDRLIFIRNCEDRELDPKTLIANYREWESKGKGHLVRSLRETFEHFDNEYNSKIFAKHLCDDLDVDNEVLHEVIEGLYTSRSHDPYDFSIIDADVLGTIYEQYLGHILKKTEKRAKLTENHTHRKEQGIYYTPPYIVDYIVRSTLGELLTNKKINAEEIKVLDPACGSGSFLIKVFDVLNEYYKQNYRDYAQSQLDLESGIPFRTKSRILQNNIFGVDLDKQAVEIAQLNLLLKITEKGHRLPLLEQNIKCGNSLIGKEDVAGSKSFDWEKQFNGIFEDGGFDIVVGNPPYVRVDNLKDEEKDYWKTVFCSANGKYDLYYLFIESVFKFLKNSGRCGFILPNKFCAASSAQCLREIIVNNSDQCSIISVSHLPVFKDAANYPVILLLRKGSGVKEISLGSVSDQQEFLNKNFVKYTISRDDLAVLPAHIFPININQKQFDLVIKLLKDNKKLAQFLKISEGLRIPVESENTQRDDFEIVKQYQFNRWTPISQGSYISKRSLDSVISPNSSRYTNMLKDKIVIAEDALSITSTIDYSKRVPQGGVYFGVLTDKSVSLEYLIGLLNSRLLSFVYNVLFGGMHMGGGYLRYRTEFLENLPIKVARQQQVAGLVKERLSVSEKIVIIGDKLTDKKASLETEAKSLDNKLDEIVFEIYGITESEKSVIENNK
jgi:uncharacterized protein YciU (UPF0263 family)